MITGLINADREALLRLAVYDQDGLAQEIEAVIDTGFSGYLTLPEVVVQTLGLAFHSQTLVTLSDGSMRVLQKYEASIVWDGQDRDVLVLAVEGGVLIGMALLEGSEVVLRVIDGGAVTIRGIV